MTFRCRQVIATRKIQDSLAVHQALCHPTILSLFSTLPADSDRDEGDLHVQVRPETPIATAMPKYLVLEYCGPHGTLSDHLPRFGPTVTSPLEESRIRGVVKTLADALVYLEKENVVHRRLIPENVYVTEDFRVVSRDRQFVSWFGDGTNWRSQKLGGFEGAVRIPSDGYGGHGDGLPVPEAEVGIPQYQLAPYVPRTITAARSNSDPPYSKREIEAGLDYTCSADVWSLGILILWMLDPSRVRPSREAQETPARANLIKSVRQESISNLYSVHTNWNGELRALVSRLLEEVSPAESSLGWLRLTEGFFCHAGS